MLTTIIYRSHFRDHVPVTVLEDMVVAANKKNSEAGVSGILLFNGKLFFQLLEGPEENVRAIYRAICEDPRHHNVVELLCDYSPARRFGKCGMELFDLRKYIRHEVLQSVLDKGRPGTSLPITTGHCSSSEPSSRRVKKRTILSCRQGITGSLLPIPTPPAFAP